MRQIKLKSFVAKLGQRCGAEWIRLLDLTLHIGVSPETLMKDAMTGGALSGNIKEQLDLVVANCTCGFCSGDHLCIQNKNDQYEIHNSVLTPDFKFFLSTTIVEDVYVPSTWAERVMHIHERKVGQGFWNRQKAEE